MRMKFFLPAIIAWCACIQICHSQRIITLDEAIHLTLQNHPLLKAHNCEVEASRAMEKSAFSVPNPIIYTEAPTGSFYTLGVSQTFEFPTVYLSQSAALKSETDVSIKKLELAKQELILEVSKAFAAAQYAVTLSSQYKVQDSIFYALQQAAQRQFEAGSIDAMQHSFAQLQYGIVHQQWLKAQSNERISLHSLTHSFADSALVAVAPYNTAEPQTFSVEMKPQSSIIALATSENIAAEKQLAAQKNKALPGFMIGYLNQGPRANDAKLNLQAGITIPLWWWQYNARQKVATAALEATKFQIQTAELEVHTLQAQRMEEVLSAQAHLNHYLQSALPLATQLRNQSKRFFDAGEIDFIQHLRTLNDVLQVEQQYAKAAYDFAVAVAELQFIQH